MSNQPWDHLVPGANPLKGLFLPAVPLNKVLITSLTKDRLIDTTACQ
jgi:hypothetical protein